MSKTLTLLGAFLRHPRIFMTLIQTLKSTRLYMNAIVAEYFKPLLEGALSEAQAVSLPELIQQKSIKNIALLDELVGLLQKTNFIQRRGERIWLKKPIPADIVAQTEQKLNRLVIEAFKTFAITLRKTVEDRLKGIPVSEFDAGELRIQWDIALRGDFYRFQRNHAFEFIKFKDLLKKSAETANILDYGCGSGDGTKQIYHYVKAANAEFNLEACDVSEGLIEIAQEDEALGLPIKFFSLKNQKPKSNYYDFIFISQVLHWHENPTELLAELKSYLKPNGILFGVQSTISKRIYQIDLFIRLLGGGGFPPLATMESWFTANNLLLTYDSTFYSFKCTKKG